jgi:hypothetical protein
MHGLGIEHDVTDAGEAEEFATRLRELRNPNARVVDVVETVEY